MGRLDGKVIILTAAAQGIGRAAALVSYRLVVCSLTVEVLNYVDRFHGYLILLYFFFIIDFCASVVQS